MERAAERAAETSEVAAESSEEASAVGSGVVSRVQVTRRALFGRDLSVWGYELMCVGDPARALSGEVGMLNALAELGVKSFVADKQAAISVGRDTLLGRIPLPASSQGTLLVLRVDGKPVGEDLLDATDERMDEGFQLALSGELWSPHAAPLIERASVLRVPYSQLALDVLVRIGPRPRGQQLWVDGVDRPEDFPNTRRFAPSYFSGDFLLRPSPVEGRRAPRNLSVLMELMSKLRQPNVGFAEIESILRRDAGLSVTLLRFLNSAGFGLRVQVSSIRQAVALLGLNEFSKWVTLVGLGDASDKPHEVLITALVRAKTCELVAAGGADKPPNPNGTAFMVGLFSLLDAMLDQPLEVILNELPVSDVLKNALLEQSGPEGEILAAVLDYERGLLPERLSLATGDMFECWQRAVQWADGLRGALPSGGAPRSRRG